MVYPFDKRHTGDGSVIGAGTRIDGDIYICGDLRLEGSMHRTVCSLPDGAATLVVAEGGRIEGDVAVRHLVLQGTICGELIGIETLSMHASANVLGNVQYGSIDTQSGAMINGDLSNVNAEQIDVLEQAVNGRSRTDRGT
jgi:cytoskeletal protein CcmA (bactofilin family)